MNPSEPVGQESGSILRKARYNKWRVQVEVYRDEYLPMSDGSWGWYGKWETIATATTGKAGGLIAAEMCEKLPHQE